MSLSFYYIILIVVIVFLCLQVVYTIEFQKRGLPHAHILLWANESANFSTSEGIDKYISAEIPDVSMQPELYNAASEFMVHGPCGALNPKSPCMDQLKHRCTKRFPKSFNPRTSFDANGYPVYMRRDNGRVLYKNGIPVDNRWVCF